MSKTRLPGMSLGR